MKRLIKYNDYNLYEQRKLVDINNEFISKFKLNAPHPEMLELLKEGADINAQDENGMTWLMYAVDRGSLKQVEEIINLGADLNKQDNDGSTAILRISYKNDLVPFQIQKLLIESGADLSIKNNEGIDYLYRPRWGSIRRWLDLPETQRKLFFKFPHLYDQLKDIITIDKDVFYEMFPHIKTGDELNLL
jgi:hypothetical protein